MTDWTFFTETEFSLVPAEVKSTKQEMENK
jgi:hypothetical protein